MNEELSYGGLACVYDMLTDDVAYDERTSYILKLLDKHLGKEPDILCDLGCGTGTICNLLSAKGIDCIGIDSSESMLSIARQKDSENKILYLLQDITEFELYGTVDVFLSMLDTLNYIVDEKDVFNIFKLVKNYLNPGGVFIFDINTKYKFENILGNNTFTYEKDGVFYSWENYYENNVLEFYLNFFVENEDGSYNRIYEEHIQRYHSLEFLQDCACKVGLELVGVYSDLTMSEPHDEDERIFLIFKN